MKSFNLKTLSIIILTSLLFSFLFTACSGSRKVFTPTQATEKIVTVKEIVRDTVFHTQPDSSTLQALIECQNGQAVIKEIIKAEPGNSKLAAPKARLKNNILTIDCEARAQELLATWKEEHKQEIQTVTITNTEYKEKELTRWQSLCLWVGKIVIFLLIGTIVAYIIGLGLKKQK